MDFVRTCSECGEEMWDGYCIDGGREYYCSEDCLHKHYTEEEWDELYADGEGDSYWTEWYDEMDDEAECEAIERIERELRGE